MRCLPYLLASTLEKKLVPFYLLYGNETFLVAESAALIGARLSRLGDIEQQIIHVNHASAWAALAQDQPSLFTPLRLIELRFTKFSAVDITQLKQLLDKPWLDTYFIIQVEQITRQHQQAKWFLTLDEKGIVVPHWPLSTPQFSKWVQQKAKQADVALTTERLQQLVYQTEGNCLAAWQEIQRLSLYAEQELPGQTQSQFDIFDLCEAALRQQPQRVLKILGCLKNISQTPLPLILWALLQTLQNLLRCEGQNAQNQRFSLKKAGLRPSLQEAYLQVFHSGLKGIRGWVALLNQLTIVDQCIKEGQTERAWEILLQVSLDLSSQGRINFQKGF